MTEWVSLITYSDGSSRFSHSDGAIIQCPKCKTKHWVGYDGCPNPYCGREVPKELNE